MARAPLCRGSSNSTLYSTKRVFSPRSGQIRRYVLVLQSAATDVYVDSAVEPPFFVQYAPFLLLISLF